MTALTAPAVPLRRNWRFQLLWLGSSTAFLGMGAVDFAYPLVILALTRSPAAAAAFGAVQTTASVLCGVPAGALVDRGDRRRVLMAAEGLRAVVALLVAIACLTGRLGLPLLLAVAAVLGACAPLGSSARTLLVRAVVGPDQLRAAMTQEEVRGALTGLAGPPLGGLLLAARRVLPFAVCALAFTVSLVTAMAVRTPPAEPRTGVSDAGSGRTGMLAGVRELWSRRVIRSVVVLTGLINLGGNALFLAVVVLLSGQGVSPRAIGIAVTGDAIGMLLGSTLVAPLHRIRPGRLLLLVSAVLTGAVFLLAVPLGPWWVCGVLAAGMLGVPAIRVLIDVLLLRQVPDEVRGRTLTALTTLMTIGMPAGTAIGGVLMQFAGATVTILAIGVLCLAGLVRGLADPILRGARWPSP